MTLPRDFFRFDLKDTLRLVIWVIISSFALGGLWAQRKADLSDLRGADATTNERIAREERAREDLSIRFARATETLDQTKTSNAAIAASLEGIRTELRYVNDKIDVLRGEVRAARKAP
jgi:septal ring factor EnvC (AmiA/AmiB activator)